MFDKQNLANFEALKSHVTSLFPAHPLVRCVAESDQLYEIGLQKESLGSQRFFFVVDLPTFTLKHTHGVQRWLGYSEKEFSLKQYWSLVHPSTQKSLMTVALQLYETLCTGRYELKFLVQRYSSRVALRHYNGHYVEVKKLSAVFQYDAANRLTAYLNEFVVIGRGEAPPLSPEIIDSTGAIEQHGAEVLRATLERFLGMKIFSPMELQTARELAYAQSGITHTEMAQVLRIAPYTVGTHCKHFLQKARDFFQIDFSTAADAALHLRKAGLL